MLLKFDIIWIRNGQIIKLYNQLLTFEMYSVQFSNIIFGQALYFVYKRNKVSN